MERPASRIAARFEHLAHKLSHLDPRGTSVGPRWLVLSINNVCNLHCYMCDVGTKTTDTTFYKNLIGDSTGNMPLARFDRLLDQAAELPFRPGVSLAYTEPAIHPGVATMIDAATRRGHFVSMTTNGYTLPKIAADLAHARLGLLFVSVDGPQDVHDDIRGSKRSYQRIVDGLAAVRRQRHRPEIHVGFVCTERSYLTLERVVRELAPLGVDAFHATLLNFVHPDSARRHNAEHGATYPATVTNLEQVDLSAFDFDAFAAELARAGDAAAELGVRLFVSPDLRTVDALRAYHLDPSAAVAGTACRDPWSSVLIQTNGDVIPSHGRCFNLVAGNIDEAPLAEVFNGDAMRRLRRDLRRAGGLFPACTRCCGVFGRTAPRSGPLERTLGLLVTDRDEAPGPRLRVL